MRHIFNVFLFLCFLVPQASANYVYNPYTTKLDKTGVEVSSDITVVCDSGKVLKSNGAGSWTCQDATETDPLSLHLNTDNDPLTGDLEISKADPEIRLTDTGNSKYTRLVRSDVTNYAYQYSQLMKAGSGGGGSSAVSAPNQSDAGRVGNSTSFMNGKSEITFSVWVKPVSYPAQYAGYLISNGSSNKRFGLGGDTIASQQLYFSVGNGTTTVTAYSGATVAGQWYHMVGTWKAGEVVNLWKNNSKNTSGATTLSGTMAMDDYLKIGVDDVSALRKCNASFDEIAIWDRKLTDAEIGDLYNSGNGIAVDPAANFPSTGTPQSTNLIVLHHCDEGSGTSLTDASGNGLTGTAKYWDADGKIGTDPTTEEAVIWSAKDGLESFEKGILTYGDPEGRHVVEGKTIRFNINAVEKWQVDALGNLEAQADSLTTAWGAAQDFTATYDGTNAILNPKAVGSGYLNIKGKTLLDDKIMFTQTDGNEYIDSLADGYLDLGATTAIRFNNSTADTDVATHWVGTTNTGILTWMEDEDQFKFTDRLQTDGGIIGKITTVTDTYTVLVSDETVICNKATAFTVTLPTAVVGQKFTIKNIGAGTVTVDGASTDTIDGSLTQSLITWESFEVQCYVANKWGIN